MRLGERFGTLLRGSTDGFLQLQDRFAAAEKENGPDVGRRGHEHVLTAPTLRGSTSYHGRRREIRPPNRQLSGRTRTLSVPLPANGVKSLSLPDLVSPRSQFCTDSQLSSIPGR